MGNIERWVPPADHIDVCATCGYQAWREHYPCNRCGGLDSIRYVPQNAGAVEALDAILLDLRAVGSRASGVHRRVQELRDRLAR